MKKDLTQSNIHYDNKLIIEGNSLFLKKKSTQHL